MFDGTAFGKEIVAAVKVHLERASEPLIRRLDAIEKRLDALPAPVAAKGPDMGEIRRMIAEDVAALRQDMDAGFKVFEAPALPELPDIAGMVAEAVADAVSALPVPENGKAGADGKDGRDGAPGEKGADGRDGIDGKAGEPGADGKDGADGRDGCGVRDLLIDRDDNLVVTMDDGRMKSLGIVVGRDGRDGAPGEKGADGKDGFGFDDMSEAVEDDGRMIVRRFTRGGEVKEFRHAVSAMLYRGVFAEGAEYRPGDVVTWGGSAWHCDKATSEKPDRPGGEKAWTLMVKRGRDGKAVTAEDMKPVVTEAIAKAIKGSKP